MKIDAIFSTPLGLSFIPNSENLNKELKTYFYQLEEKGGYRNDLPTQPEREDLFESKFDLFEHSNRAVQAIKTKMHEELIELIMQLNSYPKSIKNTLKISQHAWFHITRKPGYFTNHNHPMASWSAIYCVDSGGRPSDHPESGVTRFFHPNTNAGCYVDAGNASLNQGFAIAPINLKLEAGQIAYFPSHLMHEVSAHMGNKDRVTIAVNFWVDSELIKVRI